MAAVMIKKFASQTDINKAMDKVKKNIARRRKNPFQFFGSIKLPVDGLEYQKYLRNEWD